MRFTALTYYLCSPTHCYSWRFEKPWIKPPAESGVSRPWSFLCDWLHDYLLIYGDSSTWVITQAWPDCLSTYQLLWYSFLLLWQWQYCSYHPLLVNITILIQYRSTYTKVWNYHIMKFSQVCNTHCYSWRFEKPWIKPPAESGVSRPWSFLCDWLHDYLLIYGDSSTWVITQAWPDCLSTYQTVMI